MREGKYSVGGERSGDAARADPAGQRERLLRVGEPQLRAVARRGRPDLDLGTHHRAELSFANVDEALALARRIGPRRVA